MKEKLASRKKAPKEKGHFITLAPVTIWMIGFLIIPLIFVIIVSFFKRGIYGGIEYQFTTENYKKLINPIYFKILGDSLLIALATTALCLLFGYPFAYFIAMAKKKYRSLLLLLIIIPFWTNSLVRTYAWILLLRTEGIINQYLMKFGIISHPLTMLYNDFAVLLGLVYTLFPFMVLPLYASIEKLDKSYLQAASDLGAKPWRTFTKITLPLTMPGVVAGSLLVFIPTLGYFFIPDLMGGSKSMLISNLIKNQFFTARNWPFGAAVSIILILITFVLIGLYVKLAGGTKDTEVV